jgi:hypothetical protein
VIRNWREQHDAIKRELYAIPSVTGSQNLNNVQATNESPGPQPNGMETERRRRLEQQNQHLLNVLHSAAHDLTSRFGSGNFLHGQTTRT